MENLLKNRKNKIHIRVFSVISIMLLSTFSLIGVIFNIAARQYIQSSAKSQIDRSYHNTIAAIEQLESFLNIPLPGRTGYLVRGNIFRIEANMFFMDDVYNLLGVQTYSDEVLEFARIIKERHINLSRMRNRQIITADGAYFASAFSMPPVNENTAAYWIIFADITGLSNFAGRINTLLIILVCIMFIAAVFVTFFLSNSITRPIQKLSMLAANIGHGDFTPSDFGFKDLEFVELNTALNKSAKQLAAYDNEQKTFFQNISHELRTPLMSIQCHAEGIFYKIMEPEQASGTILKETEKLSSMIHDLLYISKIDNITTTYTAEKIDLTEIARECVRRQQAVADKKQLVFVLDFDETPVYCICVGELISRAFENLISNAIRYASSEIVLSCHENAEMIVISVKDDGAGIDTEALPHVFERFYKGTDGNYGIGLSIVKSIVDQHNGSIKAENAENGGALFTITLPNDYRRF